jgi:tetratricopeptide (TPR) repeat protein
MRVVSIALALLIIATSASAHGTADERLGKVNFQASCAPAVAKPFERAVALLHSFWYLEALKGFTAVATADPDCAMAYWGQAMSVWYQIWSPPRPAALKQGLEAVERAQKLGGKTPRDRDLIAAAATFFQDHETKDHRTRSVAYEATMEQAYARNPSDTDVALFYALALQANADPHDKSYAKQRKSGEIAARIFAAEPEHPGAAHYLIHAYDYPLLAAQARDAADRYAKFAPSAPHALHMPSHIYVLLGMWPETIHGNRVAAEAERTRGNPDDHMHALDYLVYGYLQRGEDAEARKVLEDGRRIVADMAARKYDSGRHTAQFSISAMEARYALERGRWSEAAAIDPITTRFPYVDAHIVYARAVGAARAGQPARARADVERLVSLRDALTQAKNSYWAEQVEIQRRAAAGWVARAEGKTDEAIALLRSAAELEDSTEKRSVSPGPILAAREQLGDLLLEAQQAPAALREYEASLQAAPARFRSYYGAAKAAESAGYRDKAATYYGKLASMAAPSSDRAELKEARAFLSKGRNQ